MIFYPSKLESKVIYQRGKTFFFHQKSEGILQVLKSEYEGIMNLRILPSACKYPHVLIEITVDF
jgi:hypothetical protein